MKAFYILTINPRDEYSTKNLKTKLNQALDWVQIMPNTFIIKSTSDKEKWYSRLKPVLEDNTFFLVEIQLENRTGWLPNWIWDWIVKHETIIVKKTTPTLEERGITQKDVMQKAKRVNNDEFYTRYEDVEKELLMYGKITWKNKVVFCNCDDAVDSEDNRNTSAFALYFIKNFHKIGLKKLICTHFSGKVDLFDQGAKGYVFTKTGFKELKEYPEHYTGSFTDPLSLKILNDEADIVCTNPPFSRAIDFWKIIIESGKKFLIISNISNAINTAYIPYFKDNKVWAGYNEIDWFLNSKKELVRASGFWYTNIPIKDRLRYKLLKIISLKEIPEKYKQYDDSKILIVDNCYIPNDYKKPFAVSSRPILNGILEKGFKIIQEKRYTPYVENKECFARVLIQKI